MNPCRKNRQRIAWLAMNELDPQSTAELQEHFGHCRGCRDFHLELAALSNTLAAAQLPSGFRASNRFHQELMHRLRTTHHPHSIPAWSILRAPLFLRAAFATVAILVVAAAVSFKRPVAPPPPPATAIAKSVAPHNETQPTLANYEFAVCESFEKFDAMLNRQSAQTRNPDSAATASTYSHIEASN